MIKINQYDFRVWDEEEKHFWYFNLQEILERRLNYSGSFDIKIAKYQKELMTFITDKNNEKIYEGDFISVCGYSYDEPEDDWEGVVVRGHDGWCLNGFNSTGDERWFNLSDIGGSYTTIIEKLGDIHSSPELLKILDEE